MIIRRNLSLFSNNIYNKMTEKLIEKLEKGNVVDFEVIDSIPRDVISVTSNPASLKIYIPTSLEYSQYDIDDYIRSMVPYMRTSVTLDRNIYVMKLSGSLNMDQLSKLVRFIISTEDFCSIIN